MNMLEGKRAIGSSAYHLNSLETDLTVKRSLNQSKLLRNNLCQIYRIQHTFILIIFMAFFLPLTNQLNFEEEIELRGNG